MGRHLARLAPALLLTSIALIALAGCGGNSSNPVPPSGDQRDYGPPHEEVVFVDDNGYLATVQNVANTDDPLYVLGVGNSDPVADAGSFLVKPNSTVDNAYFAVYDDEDGMLYVLNNDGDDAPFFHGAEVVEDLYAFSAGGSRIIYVRDNGDGTQSLVLEGTTSQLNPIVYATLNSGDEFVGRPTSYQSGSIRIAITVKVGGTNMIHIYDQDGLVGSKTATARGLAFNNTTGSTRRLAYIDGVPGGTSGSELVIVNESLVEFHRWDFSAYGDGALALAWGPGESTDIALFAGANGSSSYGNLIVINSLDGTVIDVNHEGDYRFPFSVDRMWGMPSWASSNTLLFTVRVGESEYEVIRTDLTGTTETLYTGLTETKYVDHID